jgi:hypothetical protein
MNIVYVPRDAQTARAVIERFDPFGPRYRRTIDVAKKFVKSASIRQSWKDWGREYQVSRG